MNTYTENGQLCPENNNFQLIYNSIINELIKLEKLSPTQSRTAIVESMLTFVFRYRSIPNLLRQQYFETLVVKVSATDLDYKILLGFRHIDDIVVLEQKKQFELEQALTEANLKNEVISALSQIYYAIFLIDLKKDLFKEISGKGCTHRLAGQTGCASYEFNKHCNEFIVPEYQDRLRQFFDI